MASSDQPHQTKRVWPNTQPPSGPYSAYQPFANHELPLRPRDRKPSALDIVKAQPVFKSYFQKYGAEELVKGMELAKKPDLMHVLRRYGAEEIAIGLNFAEHDTSSLDFFDAFKDFEHSQILECHRAINHSNVQLGYQPHDLGYTFSSFPRSSTSYQLPSNQPPNVSLGPDGSTSHEISMPMEISTSNQKHFRPHKHVSNRSSEAVYDSPAASTPASTSYSRINHNRTSKPKDWACTYCGKEFAEAGYCLNHEKTHHNQEMNWSCPHCQCDFPTKNGCERHHNKHHEDESITYTDCKIRGKPRPDSKPKTACACPYCGHLFEGATSFNDRCLHLEEDHYKAEPRMKKSNLDYSRMIQSLLRRRELFSRWAQALATLKESHTLSWDTEEARSLLESLETGNFHLKGTITPLLGRVYASAIKTARIPSRFQYDSSHADALSSSAINQPVHPRSLTSEERPRSPAQSQNQFPQRGLPNSDSSGYTVSDMRANSRTNPSSNIGFHRSQMDPRPTNTQPGRISYNTSSRGMSSTHMRSGRPDSDVSASSSFRAPGHSDNNGNTNSSKHDVFMGFDDQSTTYYGL
ncbi:hypothetical protein BU16DRAFT_76085 [Lophium mytilinum]|uniref:C2H2-type domain-containing protein n=1 Tax=Lophium mytilinum TaxID=390894 RepID=A0A6A6QLS5_9PEZI|nr:hypothetical protein BU16DRAFT_76085 [Lophium mytilinum]